MLDTGEILRRIGYDYFSTSSGGSSPPRAEVTFGDLLPALRDLPLGRKRMYMHQMRAYEALEDGKNLILRSGTGSGKTEAWFTYVARRRSKTLVVYPTLALSSDQVYRLRMYSEPLGIRIRIIDAPSKARLAAGRSIRELRQELTDSEIVLTNPAFLLNEVKRIGSQSPPLLRDFMTNLELLVIDDLDFYSPRSLAILFAMLGIIRERLAPSVRFACLTAMLENPQDVSGVLKSINGRETVIVDGEAFHPPNTTYVVLGRDLRRIWERIRESRGALERMDIARDVLSALDNYDDFKRMHYKVIEIARLAGVQLPSEWIDVSEILSNYVEDEGLTVVFTRSIARAEETARRLMEVVGPSRVAPHHHLMLKEERQEIEDAARRGEMKILVSPRTLSQGIDIGSIVRIVHLGLPSSLREYLQREGRKGRREDIERTETIIIPSGPWDHNLLLRGSENLMKWLSLPREKVIFNPENKYMTLVRGLFNLVNPARRRDATQEELDLLGRLGLRRGLELTESGRRAWLNLNFYEFAPPFGIKRVRRAREGHERRLEDISHADLVEKYQIGCIDYTSDGVVTAHVKAQGGGRVVTSVVVEDLSESVLRRIDALAYALEEYAAVKSRWREPQSIRSDYASGRLHSEVHCVVKTPNGFGRYIKVPNRVEWRLRSREARFFKVGERTILSHERRSILVPALTGGSYSDYTYGIHMEVDPRLDPELLRLGLAFMELVMRRVFSIPLDTIEYDVSILSERKFISLHETESAGLLESLDWLRLKEALESYRPDELDEPLLESINEYAYSTLTARGFDWELARHYAVRIAEYILLRSKIKVSLLGREVAITKPSRALRRATVAFYDIKLDPEGSVSLYCIGTFDGERYRVPIGIKTLEGPDNAYIESIAALSSLLEEGFVLYVYDKGLMEAFLSATHLKSMRAAMLGAEAMGSLIDVRPRVSRLLGADLSLEEAERALGLERSHHASELSVEAARLGGDVSTREKRLRALNRMGNMIERVVEADLYNIYLLSIISERGGTAIDGGTER